MKHLRRYGKPAAWGLLFGLGLGLLAASPHSLGRWLGTGLLGLCLLATLVMLERRRRDRARPLVQFSLHSRAVTLDEDGFSLKSLPPGLDCQQDRWLVQPAAAPPLLIAVVDNFSRPDRYIGARRRICHGELVARLALAGLEQDAALLACDVAGADGRQELSGLVNALEFLARRQDDGLRLDGVVLSLGLYASYRSLSRLTGRSLDAHNVGQYQQQLCQELRSANRSYLRRAGRAVAALAELSAAGTPVYVAAGNRADRECQLLALAAGVRVVGGLDSSGQAWLRGNQAQVTDWALAELAFWPQYDAGGHYQAVSCGSVSFSRAELGGLAAAMRLGQRPAWRRGTSLAAPACLNQALTSRG